MPPVVIAAGIAATATIGGAVLASKSQKKAASQAAAAQTQATDSQLQLGRENMAFQNNIYNQNKALLSPFVQRGDVAGQSINALLGLPSSTYSTPAPTQPGVTASPTTQQPLPGTQTLSNGAPFNPNLPFGGLGLFSANDYKDLSNLSGTNQDSTLGNFLNNGPLASAQQQASGYTPAADQTQAAMPQAAANSAITPMSATDAFNNFANSAGMQFQLQQGGKAIQNSAAAKGSLLSGATLKGLQNYGQQTALNNYFMPYMGLLQGQQATGAQSGAAIAGVGSNFGNTVSNIYGGMGNAIGNGADALSNAALLRGQANSNMWNGIGSGLGTLASSFAGGFGGGGAGKINVTNPYLPLY